MSGRDPGKPGARKPAKILYVYVRAYFVPYIQYQADPSTLLVAFATDWLSERTSWCLAGGWHGKAGDQAQPTAVGSAGLTPRSLPACNLFAARPEGWVAISDATIRMMA